MPPNKGVHEYIVVYIDALLTTSNELGRFGIQTDSITMSRFHSAQRKGNLERLKAMYDYLRCVKSAAIGV
jgi:hypothetical protein